MNEAMFAIEEAIKGYNTEKDVLTQQWTDALYQSNARVRETIENRIKEIDKIILNLLS